MLTGTRNMQNITIANRLKQNITIAPIGVKR